MNAIRFTVLLAPVSEGSVSCVSGARTLDGFMTYGFMTYGSVANQ